MNRYERYKDSGIPWLGEVPEHWKTLSIKRLSQVKRGASPRPIDNPDYFDDDGEYAWVRIADVTASNMYLLETTQRLSDLGKSFSVPLQPNSLFLSIAGSVGKPIITKIKACIHDGFVYFPEYKHNMKFLYYIFSSGQPYLGLGKMGTQLNLNTDTVGAIKIALPSPKEQTAIAHYLDTKLGEIDALIDKQQTLLEKLAEQRTAVITHAVTKGLNPAAPMKNSGVEWLGDVPAHWEVKRLKFSVRNISQKVESQTSDLRYFGLENIESFTGRLILNIELESEGIANKFQENDVLFGKLRPYLAKVHLATQNGLVSTETLVFRAKKAINPKFLFYFCVSKDFIDAVNGTTFGSKMPRANWEDIGNFKMLIPSLEEQAIIIDYLNQETAKIDRLCETVNQTIGRLKEYRTALITQAVTGKIKVTDE